jgi:hypothetical protein
MGGGEGKGRGRGGGRGGKGRGREGGKGRERKGKGRKGVGGHGEEVKMGKPRTNFPRTTNHIATRGGLCFGHVIHISTRHFTCVIAVKPGLGTEFHHALHE